MAGRYPAKGELMDGVMYDPFNRALTVNVGQFMRAVRLTPGSLDPVSLAGMVLDSFHGAWPEAPVRELVILFHGQEEK